MTLRADADFHTRSGQPVYLVDPYKTKVILQDTLEGISRIYRVNGQMPSSVLQHTELCMTLVDLCPEELLQGVNRERLKLLMAGHDQHEAYVGDTTSSRKKLLLVNSPYSMELVPWKEVEHAWEEWVHSSFQIPFAAKGTPERAVIKMIDLWSLYCEFKQTAMPVVPLFVQEFLDMCSVADQLMAHPVVHIKPNGTCYQVVKNRIEQHWREINFQGAVGE